MRRAHAFALAVWLAILVAPGSSADPALAMLRGTVVDDTGAVIPGATITLEGPAGTRSAVTDGRGRFAFAHLTPGAYRLTAVLTGFATTQRRMTLRAGQVRQVRLTLRVGGLTESVEVVGDAPEVVVCSSAVSTSSDARGLLALQYRQSDRSNTEQYEHMEDNPFELTERRPLSTFSVDVDTASYSNVRRFLLEDQVLPPADAVRIEELLNYFAYDYPRPEGDVPFAVSATLAVCPWNVEHRLLRIGLRGREVDSVDLPARNLVFLIDVSGSMGEADKLPLLQAGLRLLVDQLEARDRVAIVVYAGAAGLVLPPTPGDRHDVIRRALAALQAGGSTNGGEGIQLAYRIAREQFIADGVNRVVLATDGDFNVGVGSEGELVRLIERERESGVFLSVLGFGQGNIKDSTMEALADKGNGNYAYIDSLAEARKVLVSQAGATLVTIAKDVKVQVEFNPRHVQAWRLIGYENRLLHDQDFRDDRKDAGEIGAGHTLTALFELVPRGGATSPPRAERLRYQRPREVSGVGGDEWATIALRYKAPEGRTSRGLSVPVGGAPDDSPDLRFAAAVAAFGLLLRGSEHKGQATYALVEEVAREGLGADREGYRAGFLELVRAAAKLAAAAPQSDDPLH